MIKSYQFFNISMTEFQNEKSKSYKIKKRYQTKDGQWKDSDSFYIDDLLKLQALISMMVSHNVSEKEFQDKTQTGNSQKDPWENQ